MSFSQRQARNGRAAFTIEVSRTGWSANELFGFGDLNRLRFWLANDGLTDFLGLDDCSRLADDFRVGHDSLAVNNSWLIYDALFVDDARLTDDFRLVDKLWLANFFRLRHDVLVNHSSLCVDNFFLANNAWGLLNLNELWATLLRWTNLRALRHRAEVLIGVAFWTALRKENQNSGNFYLICFSTSTHVWLFARSARELVARIAGHFGKFGREFEKI